MKTDVKTASERDLKGEGRRDERARALNQATVAALREQHRRARDEEKVFVLERAILEGEARIRAYAPANVCVARQLLKNARARESDVSKVRHHLELRRQTQVGPGVPHQQSGVDEVRAVVELVAEVGE